MSRTDRADRAYRQFCRSGDPRALGRVFDLTAAELTKIAAYLVGDVEQARDVVQSAFLVAIERRASFDEKRSVMPWLCGVVANIARAERRRATHVAASTARVDHRTPLDDVQRSELRETLAAACAGLPETYRAVLELHLEHGLPAKEIARVLQRQPSTVRTQIFRGLENLRRLLPDNLASGASILGAAAAGGLSAATELAAVRAIVLRRAAAATGYAAPVAAVPGGLTGWLWTGGMAMKKSLSVAALAAVLLLSIGFWFAWRASSRAPERSSRPEISSAGHDDAFDPVTVPVDGAARRTPIAARTSAPSNPDHPELGGVEVFVRLRGSQDPVPQQHVQILRAGAPRGGLQARWALTDDEGCARIDGLRPGRVSVQIATGGQAALDIVAGQAVTVEFDVELAVELQGRVVDARGAAVPDADIWLSSAFRYVAQRRGIAPGHGQFGTFVAKSDAAGEFRLLASPTQSIAAFAVGHAPSELCYLRYGRRRAGPREIVLQLGPNGGEALVVVRDRAGQAIEAARVLVGNEVPHLLSTSSGAATSPALYGDTDAEGQCRIGRLPQGALPVQVRAVGFVPWSGQCRLAAAAPTRVDVVLDPAAEVAGAVCDDEGGPIAGVLVYSGAVQAFAGSAVETDAQGRYSLSGLAAGDQLVHAWKEGVGDVRVTLPLREGETTPWSPVLSMHPAITGTVFDAAGEPVAGAEVNAWSQDGKGGHGAAKTNAAGRFLLGPLVAGSLYNVRAGFVVSDHAGVAVRVANIAPESDIVLRPDADDVPTAGIRGRLLPAVGDTLEDLSLTLWADDQGFPIRIAKNGAFQSAMRSAGPVRLSVSSGVVEIADLGRHVLRDHEVLDLGAVELRSTGALRVVVRGGVDLSDAVATLVVDGRRYGDRRVRRDNLEWDNLPPGDWSLAIRRPGEPWLAGAAAFEIHSGQTAHVEIELRRARLMNLVVERSDGLADSVLVTARDADGRLGLRTVFRQMAAGKRQPFVLPTGAWTLEVRADSGAVGTLSITEAHEGDVAVRLGAR